MRMKAVTALAAALLLIPAAARAERAKSPADATVFVRLVGSLQRPAAFAPAGKKVFIVKFYLKTE